jgi:hypothetical protein
MHSRVPSIPQTASVSVRDKAKRKPIKAFLKENTNFGGGGSISELSLGMSISQSQSVQNLK